MFRWIKDIWGGSEPVEFISAYRLTESVARLKAATKSWSLFRVSEQAAVGRVSETRVSLTSEQVYWWLQGWHDAANSNLAKRKGCP